MTITLHWVIKLKNEWNTDASITGGNSQTYSVENSQNRSSI
jgi:hypothetical protein